MSAFMCSEAHLSLLVQAAVTPKRIGGALTYRHKGVTHICKGREAAVLAMLVRANVASLLTRYENRHPHMIEGVDDYRYTPRAMPPAVAIIKLADCFDYQACEVDNYEDTEAHAFTTALVRFLSDQLPGYDDAPWGD